MSCLIHEHERKSIVCDLFKYHLSGSTPHIEA